jgi:hypothetical protein
VYENKEQTQFFFFNLLLLQNLAGEYLTLSSSFFLGDNRRRN